jgi:hypothetical protein
MKTTSQLSLCLHGCSAKGIMLHSALPVHLPYARPGPQMLALPRGTMSALHQSQWTAVYTTFCASCDLVCCRCAKYD